MNTIKKSLVFSLMSIILLGASGNTNAQGPIDTEGMNIIFMVVDDLGWSDSELYGTTNLYKTKNINRLAERGLTFTNAYAASPLCSPTRATLLTGQASARTGIVNGVGHTPDVRLEATVKTRAPVEDKSIGVESATRLNNELPTLAKQLKERGYATGHFGKWHLGFAPYTPFEHGFDVDLPHSNGSGPSGGYLAPWNYKNFESNYSLEHIEDRMSEEAISWMQSKALDKEQPFFMNYWMFSVHGPIQGKQDLIEKYKNEIDMSSTQRSPTYAAMVETMDDAVGALLDEVDRLGIADHTAIILFSDNGGNMYTDVKETTTDGTKYTTYPTDNAPLKGGKASMYEGGIRVPCVIVWPGLTSPGTETDARIQSTDFYPTLLNLVGASIPQDYPVDGIDFSPVLTDSKWERNEPMFTYFPAPPPVPNALPPAMTVHDGKWKLIRLFHQGENYKEEHDYLLFDLENDISETTNVAAEYPTEVERLDALLENHIQETGAVVPIPNPRFVSTTDPGSNTPLWDFDEDVDGFDFLIKNMTAVWSSDGNGGGYLDCTTNGGTDPYVFSQNVSFSTTDLDQLSIRVKNGTDNANVIVRLYTDNDRFDYLIPTTKNSTVFEEKSISLTGATSTDGVSYADDLTITRIRIDPNASGAVGTVSFDYIRFQDSSNLSSSSQQVTEIQTVLYPNPVKQGQDVNIRLANINNHQYGYITVYDLQGRTVMNRSLDINESPKFSTSQLTKGLYIVYLSIEDSSEVFKLIVE